MASGITEIPKRIISCDSPRIHRKTGTQPGVEVVSIITKSSAERIGLKVGKNVYVIVKASNVMIGMD